MVRKVPSTEPLLRPLSLGPSPAKLRLPLRCLWHSSQVPSIPILLGHIPLTTSAPSWLLLLGAVRLFPGRLPAGDVRQVVSGDLSQTWSLLGDPVATDIMTNGLRLQFHSPPPLTVTLRTG